MDEDAKAANRMNASNIEKMIRRSEMPHIGHQLHLCVLWHTRQTAEMLIPLVKDAKFVCKICGRVARNQENLCEPTAI